MPATPNAQCRKVRCPKCTAVFTEPAKSSYECPICACRLSGKGASPSPVLPLNSREKERSSGLENAANRSDGRIKVPCEEECLKDKNAARQEDLEEDRGALPASNRNEGQEMATTGKESHGLSEKDDEERRLSEDGPVGGPHRSGEHEADDSSCTATNEAAEEDGSAEKGAPTSKQRDLRLLRSSRCELSFKYSLEAAHPVDSDMNRKRLPLSKFSSSMPSTEGSDAPLHPPLRVRISSRHEESSDHSEIGKYSFSSETESHDGSESDFDFPVPSAQNKVRPDPLAQYEPFHNLSEKKFSGTPHQLELWNGHDSMNKGQDAAQESSKHSEDSDIKLPLQAGDGSRTLPPSLEENELKEHEETSEFDLLSQVKHLAKIMNDVTFDHAQSRSEDAVGFISLNQQDAPVLNQHIQHNSYRGPLNHDDQALGASRSEQAGHSLLRNGIISSGLQVSLADVQRMQTMDVGKYTELHARFDDDPQPDMKEELDLYCHHKIAEWQHEEVDDFPSSAHSYEIMEHQSHDLDPRQTKVHRSGFSDDPTSSILLSNSVPAANHLFLDHHKFDSSSFEQICTYQAPSQSVMLPAPFQLHSRVPYDFNSVPSACTFCSHHQYPFMQAHSSPQCVVCSSGSGSVWAAGPFTQLSFQGLDPPLTSSQLLYAQEPTNLHQLYDFPSVDARLRSHLPCDSSRYPPLPQNDAAPYVLCKGCGIVLQVPLGFSPRNGFVQKLRCSACGRVNKFSVNQHARQGHGVYISPFLEISSASAVQAPSNLHLVQYNSGSLHRLHNQRNLPTAGLQHKEHFVNTVNTASQDDVQVFMSTSRAHSLRSQRGNHHTVQMKNLADDGPVNVGPDFKANTSSVAYMSSDGRALGLSDTVGDRQQVMAASSLHGTVDEKDEGLDFGAPRISDGESLDQSESRMRSPENVQLPRAFMGAPEADHSKTDLSDDVQQRGPPLLVLLNQESTRFSLSLDPRPPGEEVKSASWSPASDSRLPMFLKRKEQNSSQSRKRANYIAGLLRRSIHELTKGGEKAVI